MNRVREAGKRGGMEAKSIGHRAQGLGLETLEPWNPEPGTLVPNNNFPRAHLITGNDVNQIDSIAET